MVGMEIKTGGKNSWVRGENSNSWVRVKWTGEI